MKSALAVLVLAVPAAGCSAPGFFGEAAAFLSSPEGQEVVGLVVQKTGEVAAGAVTGNLVASGVAIVTAIGGTLAMVRKWRGSVNNRKGTVAPPPA